MKIASFALLTFGLLISGCGESATDSSATGTQPAATNGASNGEMAAASEVELGAPTTTAPGGGIELTSENTTIQFVGVHADPEKPDPRTGHFQEFHGTAVVEGGALQSISVEIDTTSLTTDNEKLTNHLKSPDFFDVNEHPTADFVSTQIMPTDGGTTMITGDLTLLGETRSITFPARVSLADGLTLEAEFDIDRTEFGMEYGVENVKKEVQMTINVDA